MAPEVAPTNAPPEAHPAAPGAAPVPPRIEVFGFKLNPMVKHEFLDFVGWHIAHRKRALFTHLNLHGMAMMYESTRMTGLMHRADTVVTIDGMSVLLLSRLAGHRLTARNRITSLDYIDDLLRRATDEGWTIYYVGGKPEVLAKGLGHFRKLYPGLNIAGHSGYFDLTDFSPESAQGVLLADIAARKVDMLIVGMGMPRQEEWVDAIRGRIDVPVIITIGAMLEYFAGSLVMPPRWLGPIGLEWLFRLATAPHRLAFRYLVEPFLLFGRLRHGTPPPGPPESE